MVLVGAVEAVEERVHSLLIEVEVRGAHPNLRLDVNHSPLLLFAKGIRVGLHNHVHVVNEAEEERIERHVNQLRYLVALVKVLRIYQL